MATKYVRIDPKSNQTIIQNLFGANRFIRKNFKEVCFKVASTGYSNGDKLEFRLAGAKKILFFEIQNASTGAKIAAEATSTFTKGTLDVMAGMYIRTEAIATAVDLNVLIKVSIDDTNAINFMTPSAS